MRVISGSARGVVLKTPDGMKTRPTADRVKEAMFSIIQFDLPGTKILDLFGGTGQLGIEGLKRVLTNRNYTTSKKVQEELDEYEETNNPILGFFKECQNEDFEFENEPTSKVYKKYQEYCLTNTLTPMSNGEFSKQVKKHFNFAIIDKKIQGKKYRMFVKG